MESSAAECRFNVCGRNLIARRWGDESGLPVIALHGWMDNAASFDFLAPALLEDQGLPLNIVALDLAGHGKSDHKQGMGAYNIWQDLGDILAVADQMDWDRFGLIGHSRGAMIASLLAGTFPERVTHLVALESIVPEPVEASRSPDQLANSLREQKRLVNKKQNYYPDLDSAILAREQGLFRLTHADASALASRGVEQDQSGFYWRIDPKLLAPSEVKLTMEQVNAFFDRVPVEVQLFAGSEGMVLKHRGLQEWLAQRENISVHYLQGDHHLHMSTQAKEVAKCLKNYFS